MGHKFAAIAFTDTVKKTQTTLGSRSVYSEWDEGPDYHDVLGERESNFIARRDSFYVATVSETGWPYVQHRGGPTGFVRVISKRKIGFSDFRGNRQYVSVGNVSVDERVSLFFMDYPNRMRLKLFGRMRIVDNSDSEALKKLKTDGYRALVERGFIIEVEAFDWNCPQHITPRYSELEIQEYLANKQ